MILIRRGKDTRAEHAERPGHREKDRRDEGHKAKLPRCKKAMGQREEVAQKMEERMAARAPSRPRTVEIWWKNIVVTEAPEKLNGLS
jgi:hypothetical protein